MDYLEAILNVILYLKQKSDYKEKLFLNQQYQKNLSRIYSIYQIKKGSPTSHILYVPSLQRCDISLVIFHWLRHYVIFHWLLTKTLQSGNSFPKSWKLSPGTVIGPMPTSCKRQSLDLSSGLTKSIFRRQMLLMQF